MDFELTDDQRSLADLVRTIVAGRFPLERIRRAEEARQVVDADDWAALGEAGVFSLTVPEADGGVGLGLADAAVVFEELGRGLVPGPLVATHLAASVLQLNGAADGTLVVGDARPGDPCLVEHLDSLGALVVDRPAGLSVVDGRRARRGRRRGHPRRAVTRPADAALRRRGTARRPTGRRRRRPSGGPATTAC